MWGRGAQAAALLTSGWTRTFRPRAANVHGRTLPAGTEASSILMLPPGSLQVRVSRNLGGLVFMEGLPGIAYTTPPLYPAVFPTQS